MIRPEFDVHMLNDTGKIKASNIAQIFTNCLESLEIECGQGGREMAIVRTKLEEAAFFAKKAMAIQTHNQVKEDG